MLTDLSHGNQSFAAVIVLGAILACASQASAQPANAVISDKAIMDLHQAVTRYFNVPPGRAGSGEIVIKVHMRLDKTGAIVGSPEVTAAGGSEADRKSLSAAALRAVLRASPFTMLPKEKYESWKEVVLRFKPPSDPTP
ncbi:hypothetical protein ACU8KG_17460 [Rhizobium leguminosarum]